MIGLIHNKISQRRLLRQSVNENERMFTEGNIYNSDPLPLKRCHLKLCLNFIYVINTTILNCLFLTRFFFQTTEQAYKLLMNLRIDTIFYTNEKIKF